VLLFSAIREKITDNGVVTLNPKGGYDLYAVKRLGEKTWTLPTHLESYASGLNDTYPSYLAETNSLAFMSGVESKGIYNGAVNVIPLLKEVGVVPIMLLSGKVLDAQKKPVAGDVLVVDPYTSAVRAKYAISKIDGSYFAVLRGDENYQIDIRAAGYTVASEIYNFRDEVLTENRVENKDYVLATEVGLQLNVYDNTIFEPLDVKIDVFEAGTENPTGIQAKSVGAGIYKFVMPIGKSYVFRFSKKSFVSAEMLLDLGGDVFYQQFERDVELQANTKEISINVSDSETEQNMDVDIVVTNLDNNETIYLKAKRGTDGKYKVNLREGDRYEVKVRNPKGYAYYTTQVDMKNPDTQQVLDVKMVKLNARTKLELKAITFEYNSAELKKSSFTELTRVLELLKDNPELKVEVAAHTDDLGTDAYNLKLSDKRAESVMNYLVEQGLVRENIIAKGYGESSPLIPNTDDASRAKNRRVELKILE
jgi:outer membrane protein OmpA-like peptidoglycan-associated protein